MARVTKTLSPVRGRRYRVTRLDSCGNPVFGDDGQVVTSGVVSAAFTATTTSTDEIRVTNSNGDTCVFEPAVTSLEGFSAEIQFCGMDPDMFEMLTGMPVIYDFDGAAVGVAVDVGISLEDFAFGLEIWTGLAGDDACGQVGDVEYGYILTPYMKGGHLNDFTVENGAINFTVSDASSRQGGGWGAGPYGVVVGAGDLPSELLVPLTSTQVLVLMLTKVAPPAASIGGRPLLDSSWDVQTGVTATHTGLEADFTITPGVGDGQGAYYDFGDDTWDYVTTDNGDTTHTYAAAGTYHVSVLVGGFAPVTVSVTVTETS